MKKKAEGENKDGEKQVPRRYNRCAHVHIFDFETLLHTF